MCLQAHCHLSINGKLSVSRQFSETYGVTSYGNGGRKDVVNRNLVFTDTLVLQAGGYKAQD